MKKNNLFYIAIVSILFLSGLGAGRYFIPKCSPCDVQKIYVQNFQHDTIFAGKGGDIVVNAARQIVPKVIGNIMETSFKKEKYQQYDEEFWDEDGDSLTFTENLQANDFDVVSLLGIQPDNSSNDTAYTPVFIPYSEQKLSRYEGSTQRGDCKLHYVVDTWGRLENFKYTVSCPRRLRQGTRFSVAGGFLAPVNKSAPFSWYLGAGVYGVEVQANYGAGRFQHIGLGYRASF